MAPDTPLLTPLLQAGEDHHAQPGLSVRETLHAARAQGDCETTAFSSPSK